MLGNTAPMQENRSVLSAVVKSCNMSLSAYKVLQTNNSEAKTMSTLTDRSNEIEGEFYHDKDDIKINKVTPMQGVVELGTVFERCNNTYDGKVVGEWCNESYDCKVTAKESGKQDIIRELGTKPLDCFNNGMVSTNIIVNGKKRACNTGKKINSNPSNTINNNKKVALVQNDMVREIMKRMFGRVSKTQTNILDRLIN
jgi:hypothetical protein